MTSVEMLLPVHERWLLHSIQCMSCGSSVHDVKVLQCVKHPV